MGRRRNLFETISIIVKFVGGKEGRESLWWRGDL